MTATITLISAAPGDIVPGHELADPTCPDIPGLLDRGDVTNWLNAVGYGPDDADELVYLVTDPDETIPSGYPTLTVRI
jgi:hypothetical protein